MSLRKRHGTALLIVLATLVVVVTTAVSLLSLASTESLRRRVSSDDRVATDLLLASDPAIISWLQREADQVVLPPDVLDPVAPVLAHIWSLQGRLHEIRITAWDQCGMVPVDAVRSGSSVRRVLPEGVLRVVDQADEHEDQGLDLYRQAVDDIGGLTLYPRGSDIAPLVFYERGIAEPHPSPEPEPASHQPALGAFFASHNPGLLNLNTAPIELLEAVLRRLGRGGFDQIVEARANGDPPVWSSSDPRGRRETEPLRPVLGSTSWAMRIDVRVGLVARSCWAIYQRPSLSSDEWECVQRLAITE